MRELSVISRCLWVSVLYLFLCISNSQAQSNAPYVQPKTVIDPSLWEVDFSLFSKGQIARGNDKLLPIIDVRDVVSGEIAGIIEARHDKLIARTRLTSTTSNTTKTVELDAQLLELAWDDYLSDTVSIRMGKTFLGWDPGFVTQPVGFFQGNPDFADLTDFESRLEGVWLASLTYGKEDYDITLVVGETAKDSRLIGNESAQFAIKTSKDFNSLTLSGIGRITDTGNAGLGATMSTTIGQSIVAQGSVFTDDNGTRATAGGTWLSKSGLNISTELSYDELNNDDLQFISSTSPTFFADLRVSQSYARWSWAASIRRSLRDDGGLLTFAASKNISNKLSLRTEAGVFMGEADSNFGRRAIKDFISISAIHHF